MPEPATGAYSARAQQHEGYCHCKLHRSHWRTSCPVVEGIRRHMHGLVSIHAIGCGRSLRDAERKSKHLRGYPHAFPTCCATATTSLCSGCALLLESGGYPAVALLATNRSAPEGRVVVQRVNVFYSYLTGQRAPMHGCKGPARICCSASGSSNRSHRSQARGRKPGGKSRTNTSYCPWAIGWTIRFEGAPCGQSGLRCLLQAVLNTWAAPPGPIALHNGRFTSEYLQYSLCVAIWPCPRAWVAQHSLVSSAASKRMHWRLRWKTPLE
jgi:hypothetical protein